MKPAINQWAFPADMPATECISRVKQVGFEAFEVCVGTHGPVSVDASEREITAIRKHAETLGIALHSVGCGDGWKYPIGSNNPAVRKEGMEILTKSLRIAQCLGADALLVVPAVVNDTCSYDEAIENTLESVQALVPVAEETRVAIALENVWNKFLLSPVETRDFIDECDSDYVGAYVDVGNIISYGYPEQWIRILGSRVKAIHMKDFKFVIGNINGFVMLMEGDVNWPAVAAALREIGYDKSLTAEYGPYGHSLDAMLKHVLTSIQTILTL